MGFMTKQLLNKMSDTLAPKLISIFCSAVRDFYTTAVTYMIKNFTLGLQVLKHAKFVILHQQASNFNLDDLHDEFVAYKTLADLPHAVVKLAMVTETKG